MEEFKEFKERRMGEAASGRKGDLCASRPFLRPVAHSPLLVLLPI